MQPYQHLFQPLRLGHTVLKNRIEAAPVSVSNLSPQAHFTPENIAVFERKAKGGAAVINMGEARIDLKTGISHWLCLALDDPEVLPSLLWATDAIKRHNAIPAVEILHPGGRANPAYYDGPIWAPSDAPGHLGKDYTALDEETSKIPELIDELTGGSTEDESADASAQASFLDGRNGDTASVQFVIMTEGISEPEAEAEPAPAEEEQGFFAELWDRIVALFT